MRLEAVLQRGGDAVLVPAARRHGGVLALICLLPGGWDMGCSVPSTAWSPRGREGAGAAAPAPTSQRPPRGRGYSRARHQHDMGLVAGQALEMRQQLPGGGRKGLGQLLGGTQPCLHAALSQSHRCPYGTHFLIPAASPAAACDTFSSSCSWRLFHCSSSCCRNGPSSRRSSCGRERTRMGRHGPRGHGRLGTLAGMLP